MAHGLAAADHVANLKAAAEFAPQGFNFAQITEGFGPADDLTGGVPGTTGCAFVTQKFGLLVLSDVTSGVSASDVATVADAIAEMNP